MRQPSVSAPGDSAGYHCLLVRVLRTTDNEEMKFFDMQNQTSPSKSDISLTLLINIYNYHS